VGIKNIEKTRKEREVEENNNRGVVGRKLIGEKLNVEKTCLV